MSTTPKHTGYFRYGGFVFLVTKDGEVKQLRKIDASRHAAHRFLAPLPRKLRDESLLM